MDPITEDVPTPDPSPAPVDAVIIPEPTPEPAPVSGDGQGRTIDNVYGEMNRKFTGLQDQVAQLVAVLQAAAPRPADPAPVRAGWDQYTDEQLAQLAQSGSTDAQRALTQREATRVVDQRLLASNAANAAVTERTRLYGQYKQLMDPQNPLTQAAMLNKMRLVQAGYAAQDPATDVAAIREAIIQNPSLAAAVTPAPPAPRRMDPSPQSGLDTGGRGRPTPRPQGPKVDPKVAEIARRYGVDPQKALANFDKRQQSGQSGVSPQVALIVREQGGA